MIRRYSFILAGILMLITTIVQAQCAMCRTQVVNNVSAGETNLAAGLNFGIMYLFVTPYLLVALVIFLWFRYSKVNEKPNGLISIIKRKMSKV